MGIQGIEVREVTYPSPLTAAYEFVKNKPLSLLNGNNLLFLLEKHGRKARIDIAEAKRLQSGNSN
jgi:restriction system protein